MSTNAGKLASRIERLSEELNAILREAEDLEERAGGPIGTVYVSRCLDEARNDLAPALRVLTENDPPDTPVEVTLTRSDLRALNVLISAAWLASDGELSCGRHEECGSTPEPIRRVWRAVLEHTETAIEKIEAASPYSGDDLLGWRGEALAPLVEKELEGETPPSSGLTLSEEEVWALGVDLWRIASAVEYPIYHEMRGARNCPRAVCALANRVLDHLFERAGIQLGDERNHRLSHAAAGFSEKAAKLGSDAVERAALEEVGS